MFEDLKQAIQENTNTTEPEMSNWWSLISDIEKAVPVSMHHKGWKTYIKKAARILFYREVCQDESITSTKDLTAGTLWEIHKWINGENDIEHCFALEEWFTDNQLEIFAYAATDVKPVTLSKAKARRDEKKRQRQQVRQPEEDDIPF